MERKISGRRIWFSSAALKPSPHSVTHSRQRLISQPSKSVQASVQVYLLKPHCARPDLCSLNAKQRCGVFITLQTPTGEQVASCCFSTFFFPIFVFVFFFPIPFSFPQLAYPDSLLPIGRNPDPGNELTRGASMEWGRCLNTPDVSKTVERGIWGLPTAWSRKRKRKKETKEKS